MSTDPQLLQLWHLQECIREAEELGDEEYLKQAMAQHKALWKEMNENP